MQSIFESDLLNFITNKRPRKASRYNVSSDINTNQEYKGNVSLIKIEVKEGTYLEKPYFIE